MTVKQVWQADDGSTHDTEEAANQADVRHRKYGTLERMYNESPYALLDFIVKDWDAIKKLMEGE